MRCSVVVLLCVFTFSGVSLPAAAEQVLPDELEVQVGDVAGVGSDVTLVLTKRSMRSDDYLCGIWTDGGFRKVTFPVSTYRGYVQGDPAIRVTANIEPGGILNANLNAGRGHVAHIREMKIEVPAGKSTRTMSTGNKVVPLSSLKQRRLPTPSGCLVPPVPMRQSRWIVYVPQSYTEQFDLEKVVSRVEQRWSDADHVFARDVGTAWAIDTLILTDPKSTKPIDWDVINAGGPDRREGRLHGHVSGVPGRNHGKGNSLAVSGDQVEAGILLHEGAHVHGNPWHQMDPGDGLFGGGAFFGRNNVQVLISVTRDPAAYCHRGEAEFPGVIYNGVLPPSAMRDFASTRKDQPVTIDVLENDYSGSANYPLSLQAVQPESDKGGTVAVHEDGRRAVYTPPPGFVGMDGFTYTVADSTGAANKSGIVKVDVRGEGLAVHFDFEEVEKDSIEWMRKIGDWRLWYYDTHDPRPEAEKVTYRFRNLGPYDGGDAVAQWIDYEPMKGIRGNGLLNPVGGRGAAQVDLSHAGDPGRESLSASIWVLFPEPARDGVILCKSAYGFKTVISGWAIRATNKGFSFVGNTVSLLPNRAFELHTEEPIEPRKWYHLAMVIDRDARRLRAYVNNKEVTASETTPNIPDEVIEYHAPLRLFSGFGWKGWNAQPMLVDEVKIFTSALTPGQVAELYAEGRNAPMPKLPLAVVIVKAEYGVEGRFQDVTDVVRRSIVRGEPRIQLPSSSYNGAFGDPAQGVLKELRIQYRMDGKAGEAVFAEDAPIVLPMPE